VYLTSRLIRTISLDVESSIPDAFDDQDIQLAESLADTMALAMENASHYAATSRQATDLSALYTVTRMTSQTLSIDSVLSQALSSVLISLEFEAGLIALTDPVDEHMYLAAEYGLPRHLSEQYHEDGMAGSLSEHVHQKRESVVIEDFRRETEGVLGELAQKMARFGLRGYSGIPLLHRDISFGTMSLFSNRRRTFSTNQMVLLEAIGRQVATAVTNARLFQATVNERQRLVTLIESSRDGIILVGLDQRILVVNATAIAFLRLSGAPQDWMRRPLREALDALAPEAPEAVAQMMAEMTRIRAGDESPGQWECVVSPRTLQGFNLPVVADRNPLGRLLVLRDVTEERMLDKMRDDLTHTMVHDLRNPLTGISTALKLLDRKLSGALTPAQHRLIEIADSSAQKMIDLVSAILDVSQLESGRMPISPAMVSLPELFEETLTLQMPLAAAKDLLLEADIPANVVAAWADPGLVRRVLQNLVGNAVKFTPAGGRVTVKARRWHGEQGEDDLDMLCISVADTGLGVSPELQGSLFQKFVVGEHQERGSGLGLAFCRLAVEAHGGRIWLESEPSHGATFRFTLPIAADGG
jgi:NtrC-family two-component system sensor histidine kinase KinB